MGRKTYFPLPITKAKGLRISCLAFELFWEGSSPIFVAKSADCEGCRGEGSTVDEALRVLTRSLEEVVLDKDGGLYSGQSSFAFQEAYLRDDVDGWETDGVSVKTVSRHTVVLFE